MRGVMWVLVAISVLTAVFWYFIPTPAVVAPSVVAEAFSVPTAPQVDAGIGGRLAAQPVWGVRKSAAASAATDAPWRFVGAVGARENPKDAFVLVSIDGKDPETRRVGDTLPGGATIVRIRHDQICVRIDGQERTLSVSSL